jgi:cob(I)alamin adenosyltransferase
MSRKYPDGPRVVLLTGDGKGKTTSALGMALRAAGHGMRVSIVQFIKSRGDTGEVKALSRFPEVEIVQCGLGFIPPRTEERKLCQHRVAAEKGLETAAGKMSDPHVKMVVLDEICGAIYAGLLAEERVLEIIEDAHPGLIVVLTGRNASQGLIDRADTVSRVDCVKHGMAAGWVAQDGVEL